MRTPKLILVLLALAFSLSGCGTSIAFMTKKSHEYEGFQGVYLDAIATTLASSEGSEYLPLSVVAVLDIPLSAVGDILSYPVILAFQQSAAREQELSTDPEHQMKRLEDSDRSVREDAARKLGKLAKKDPSAYKILLETLIKDDEIYVRFACAQALGNYGDSPKEVFEALAVASREQEPLGTMALDSLAKLAGKNSEAVEVFCRVLSSEYSSYENLRELPTSPYSIKIMKRLLQSKSLTIRAQAAFVYADVDYSKAEPILKEALRADALKLRLLAAEAMIPVETEFADLEACLKEALESEEWAVHQQACRIVKKWGPGALSIRRQILKSYTQRQHDSKAIIEALLSMNVRDESHLLTLVYGLRDLDLSARCAFELDQIRSGDWGPDWVTRRAQYLEKLKAEQPDLIPLWYLNKEAKALQKATD